MRKLLKTIWYVAASSFKFYVVVMIYVLAWSFSHFALQWEEGTSFRGSFEVSYRNTFTDFGAEEERSNTVRLIAFLIGSYFGPLVLLTLLISIMAESVGEFNENWMVEEAKGVYTWA